MQKACQDTNGTMAAILGLSDEIIESSCSEIDGVVKPANYNCPGQLVISGEIKSVEKACQVLKEKGARRALVLPVSGAFHSELMSSAVNDLKKGIEETDFTKPSCPIYQNFTGCPEQEPAKIKTNLLKQLTGAVLWNQTINKMIDDGVKEFYEVGPGNTLQGLIRKTNREVIVDRI